MMEICISIFIVANFTRVIRSKEEKKIINETVSGNALRRANVDIAQFL